MEINIVKILVIDDHPLFIDGVSQVLRQLDEQVSITKALEIDEALVVLNEQDDFDLILLDLSLPGKDGFSFLQRFSAKEYCIPVVVVSAEENLSFIRQALKEDVLGFVPKSHSATLMLTAFRTVLAGDVYLPESIVHMLNRTPNTVSLSALPPHAKHAGISAKQYAVLQLIVAGHSNQSIAQQLSRTENTVKSHVAALFQILGVTSRVECVNEARNRGLVNQT
jgi:DNA-binding NarL/FixJ family response regulator